MIFPAHRVFVAARQLDLQVAVSNWDSGSKGMTLIPYRHQEQGPDVIATPCNDREFVDVEARTFDGSLLVQLLSEEVTT